MIRVRFPVGAGNFCLRHRVHTALGPTQPPIKLVPEVLSLAVKRPGREPDHSPPSSTEVKECVELYLHSPSTPSWRGAQLENTEKTLPFYLYLYIFRAREHRSVYNKYLN
jgi:hypothetical protein